MKRKFKPVLLIPSILILIIMVYVVSNLFFSTVEVFVSGDTGYGISPIMYTLYYNKLLVRSKVGWRAENNSFVRLFRLPERITIISQADSIHVRDIKHSLIHKESEFSYDFAKEFRYQVVVVGGVQHYIIFFAGTSEAVELYDLLSSYFPLR